jgi:hypothetical protein
MVETNFRSYGVLHLTIARLGTQVLGNPLIQTRHRSKLDRSGACSSNIIPNKISQRGQHIAEQPPRFATLLNGLGDDHKKNYYYAPNCGIVI